MAKSVFDKPAEEWTEKEIEVEKLRLEAHRAKAEGSIGRRYGTIILSGVATIAATVLTYYYSNQADVRANMAAREETERNLAQNAVRVYFENPERFDLKTEEGKFNLRVLADTAPGKTTATLISQIQDNAVQVATANAEIAAASTAGAAAVTAPGAPPVAAAPAEAKTLTVARDDAAAARYASLANSINVVQSPSKPGDFRVLIAYGAAADAMASDVQKRLTGGGYNAQKPELTTTPADKPEIRYFYRSQEKFVEDLAGQLKEVFGGPPAARYMGDKYTKLPSDLLEVWVPPQGLSTEQAYKQGFPSRQFQLNKRNQDNMVRQQSNAPLDVVRRPAATSSSAPSGN